MFVLPDVLADSYFHYICQHPFINHLKGSKGRISSLYWPINFPYSERNHKSFGSSHWFQNWRNQLQQSLSLCQRFVEVQSWYQFLRERFRSLLWRVGQYVEPNSFWRTLIFFWFAIRGIHDFRLDLWPADVALIALLKITLLVFLNFRFCNAKHGKSTVFYHRLWQIRYDDTKFCEYILSF